MDIYTIQEEAYKRGYEAGQKDATAEMEEVVCHLRKRWHAAQTHICTMCGHFDHKTDGNIVYGNLMCGELVGYPCCGKFTPWIPVTERLPELESYTYSVNVLFHVPNENSYVGYVNLETGRWRSLLSSQPFAADEVTHWMPLPEPPKGE